MNASCLFCPDDDEDLATPASEFGDDPGTVDFSSYVNQVSNPLFLVLSFILTFSPFLQTPLTVSPKQPLEIVMDLFKKMGCVSPFVSADVR